MTVKTSFKDITTMRVGGEINRYVEVSNLDELKSEVGRAKKNGEKIFIIGGGSDILVSDEAFDGLVIKFIGSKLTFKDELVTAEAGLSWDKLVEEVVSRGLQGIECLSGIPGTVGAAPIQNIGAYGQELSDTFQSLTAYDIKKEELVTFTKSDCKFSYRESIFKDPNYWQSFVIIDVTLKLNKNGKVKVKYESLSEYLGKEGISDPNLSDIRSAVLSVRSTKFEDPVVVGNSGSFFKNVVVTSEKLEQLKKDYPDIKYFEYESGFKIPSGWLIEKAGWKGKTVNGAGVSAKHALVLINASGNAKAADVYDLSSSIIKDVEDKFGITLEREVQLINFNV